jgi:hypothetical protein
LLGLVVVVVAFWVDFEGGLRLVVVRVEGVVLVELLEVV